MSRVFEWVKVPLVTLDEVVQRLNKNMSRLAAILREQRPEWFQGHGSVQDSGTGAQTAFSWNHSLGFTPTLVSVVAGSADADGDFYVTVSATQITVTYGTAPASGTNNLTWWWAAG